MKRRDLQPGAFFRYLINPAHVYWVPERGEDGKPIAELKPDGVLYSGPNPVSDDWDREVIVVDEQEVSEVSERWAVEKAEREAAAASEQVESTEPRA